MKWSIGMASVLALTVMSVHGFGKKTFFGIRSQGTNAVRDLVGVQELIHRYDRDYGYSTFSITADYSNSFNPDAINRFLFGQCKMQFTGSRVANRKSTDILADYWGLPADYQSIVCFKPHITNFVMDFDWYLGLENVARGLYVRLHMPIVHTKWDVGLGESVIDGGSDFYPAGYMGPEDIQRSALAPTVKAAFRGRTTFGDMKEALAYGIIFERESITRLGECAMIVGWDYLEYDWWHAGLNARAAAGTGNKSKAKYLFEPMAGNDHWEVGVGGTAHIDCWESDEHDRWLALYADINITHLFGSEEKRSFDLKSGHGSRYMLLSAIDSPSQDLFIGAGGPAAVNQYQRRLVPAINQTTLDAKIEINAQIDFVLKLAYHRKGIDYDFGYNFWYRSREKLRCRERFTSGYWALKGDAQLYGFTALSNFVPLSVSQSKATINAGAPNGNANFTNANADNPVGAANSGGILTQLTITDATALNIPLANVQTSNPPILLTDFDIDEYSALLPRALSNKLFCHVGRVWKDLKMDWEPYIGGGVSVELADTDPCDNSTVSQWAIWLKGGFSY